MSSPEFSLSLDEFPILLEVPTHSEAHVGEKVVSAVRHALETYRYPELFRGNLPLHFNKLRNMFLEQDDTWTALAFADLTFATFPWDSDVLAFLNEWFPETESVNDIRALLSTTTQLRHLPSLYSACLRRVSQICERAEFLEIARPLFFAWQELPTPTYPEFDWLPLVVRRVGSRMDKFPAPLHPLTTPPETVEDAVDGWRDGRWNPITAQQEAMIRPLLVEQGLEPWADTIVALSQNCICFEPKEHKPHQIGISRFGGLPDVPDEWQWPKKMEFLAQFNLEEIAPFDVNKALPPRGLLRVFAGSLIYGEIDLCYVEWDENDVAQFKRASCPEDYDVDGLDEWDSNHRMVYSPLPVTPCRVISLPDAYNLYLLYKGDEQFASNPNVFEPIYEIQEQLSPLEIRPWNHQLLGNYEYGEEQTEQSDSSASIGRKDAWTLLCQIASNEDIGMIFNDVRTLFFTIRREGLASRRFNNVCSGLD